MKPDMLAILVVTLGFAFLNGMQGSANVTATLVSSRVMNPRPALWMAAIAEALGPFLFGIAIANTIGEDLLEVKALTPLALFVGVFAALMWQGFTTLTGIPSSTSHALFGGLIGAAVQHTNGLEVLKTEGLITILVGLFISPLVGLAMGFLLVKVIYFFGQYASPRINWWFKQGQVLASFGLGLSFGSNDGQKIMGILGLGLLLTGMEESFVIPTWVVALSAGALASGTLFGGTRLIRTMSSRFYKIRPMHGLAAQTASSGVILLAALTGIPVSTTQMVSSSIIGAGSADRMNKVRWQVFDRIGYAWFLTIPAAAGSAALILYIIERVQHV